MIKLLVIKDQVTIDMVITVQGIIDMVINANE